MKELPSQLLKPNTLLVSVGMVVAIGLVLNLPPGLVPQRSSDYPLQCQEIVQPKEELSQQQLAQLLSVPLRSQRRQVQNLLHLPYCRLSSLSLRAGATTERQVYHLAPDPQTSLIVLYEGKSYVGYGFRHS